MSQPVVIRGEVKNKGNYLEYKEDLRKNFCYSCAYCSTTEFELPKFEIDHYRPKVSFSKNQINLADQYEKLYWCCSECNSNKSDWFPDDCYESTDPRRIKNRVIQVDKEDPREHLKLNIFEIEGISETGIFHEKLLRLNRQSLIRIRQARTEAKKNENEIAFGVNFLKKLPIDLLSQSQKLKVLNLRQKLLNEAQAIDQLIEDEARNRLLDVDPTRNEQSVARKEYLTEQGAIPYVYRKKRKTKYKR